MTSIYLSILQKGVQAAAKIVADMDEVTSVGMAVDAAGKVVGAVVETAADLLDINIFPFEKKTRQVCERINNLYRIYM